MEKLITNYITYTKQDEMLFKTFYEDLKTSKSGDNTQPYPVAQTPQWFEKVIKRLLFIDRCCQVYIKNIHDDNPRSFITYNQDVKGMRHLTNLLQQRFFMYIQTLRGDRLNDLGSKAEPIYGGEKMISCVDMKNIKQPLFS